MPTVKSTITISFPFNGYIFAQCDLNKLLLGQVRLKMHFCFWFTLIWHVSAFVYLPFQYSIFHIVPLPKSYQVFCLDCYVPIISSIKKLPCLEIWCLITHYDLWPCWDFRESSKVKFGARSFMEHNNSWKAFVSPSGSGQEASIWSFLGCAPAARQGTSDWKPLAL